MLALATADANALATNSAEERLQFSKIVAALITSSPLIKSSTGRTLKAETLW
jgi:hypothetical protein